MAVVAVVAMGTAVDTAVVAVVVAFFVTDSISGKWLKTTKGSPRGKSGPWAIEPSRFIGKSR